MRNAKPSGVSSARARNSVIRNSTASMRSATARESTRHAARLCQGARQWDQTIYHHTHPPPLRQIGYRPRRSARLPGCPATVSRATRPPAPAPASPAAARSAAAPRTTVRRPGTTAGAAAAAVGSAAAAGVPASGSAVFGRGRPAPGWRRHAGMDRPGAGPARLGGRGPGAGALRPADGDGAPAPTRAPRRPPSRPACALPRAHALAVASEPPTHPAAATAGHRGSSVGRLTALLAGGVGGSRPAAAVVVAHAHTAGGSGDRRRPWRPGRTGSMQGAHGQPPPVGSRGVNVPNSRRPQEDTRPSTASARMPRSPTRRSRAPGSPGRRQP